MGLASSAVGLTGKATSTVAAIRALFESPETPDSSETATLLNSLATELTSANMMNVQLSDALRVLSAELRQQDEFANEAARYELFQTEYDALVYRLKDDANAGQQMHYVCPVCMKRDKIISFVTGLGDYKRCQTDSKHVYQFSKTPLTKSENSRFF